MAVQSCRTWGAAAPGVPFSRAARELGLKPREFELAVQLGHVRTLPSRSGGRRRVAAEEIERHRGSTGFPEALRSRVWVVGTAEGAELLGIGPARFTRLAKAGCFAPVRFYVNRYRAVVWHYLASELAEFADAQPALLTGRTPPALRAAAQAREDHRALRWRNRRTERLTALADDPWERAAVIASVLGPEPLADAVPDRCERAYVTALRPEFSQARPVTPAVREVIDTVVLASDPDEIARYRSLLIDAVVRARANRPAPRLPGFAGPELPGPHTTRATPPVPTPPHAPDSPKSQGTSAGAAKWGLRALWGRVRRRG
ncbi:DUF6397 family protein [Streptomyces gamaensis]|uniref:DUF6397 family protein n=1 Tax=Streptomyces gamaensis TaxID=1763542 RepID=A0ABW0YY59_9ACTN